MCSTIWWYRHLKWTDNANTWSDIPYQCSQRHTLNIYINNIKWDVHYSVAALNSSGDGIFWLWGLIPHPVVSEHRWLVKPLGGFTVSLMSRAGGRDVAVAMRDCGISTTSQTRPVCKHCFSALPIDKTLSVEAQIGLLWRSFCSSSYRVWD